jgi:hypothetical protein
MLISLLMTSLTTIFSSRALSPPVINKKVHRKKLADKDQKVEEPVTSSDNEGSTERPAKKLRTASSASAMHVQPLHNGNDDDHNLLLSTLTSDHGVFMTEAEMDKIDNLQIPLLDVDGAHGISFQNLTGGYGAIFSDSFDQAVWAYFKPADGETVETITSTIAELQKCGPGFMIWNSQDRTFEVYFGDAGMQAFQAQQGELPGQAQRNLTVFVDAYAGPENLVDATRLAAEMLPDYRLAIEREILQLVVFQIVDSGATVHLVPVYIANTMMVPVPPPAPYVPVINLDDFLFDEEDDDEEDDAEPFEPPPGGPSTWIAPAAPVLPIVPVLDLDAFLEGVDESVQLLPDGPALNFDPALGSAVTADLAGQLTMLPRSYGLRSSSQQWLDRIQLQEVPSYVSSSNENLERRHAELVSHSRHAFDGQVYMVYGASAAATAPRHSRPESFNDITRQHIGHPDRILRDLQFPVPAFWPMTDSWATVNVVWDTCSE